MCPQHSYARLLAIVLASAISATIPVTQAQMVAVERDTGFLYLVSPADATLTFIGDTELLNVGALEYNPSDDTLYGLTTGASPLLYELRISPGWDDVTTELRGVLGVSVVNEGGLAFDGNGTAYGLNGGSTIPLLFRFDPSSAGATNLVALDGRHDIAGLGWRSDGLLIGLDSTLETLLTIDPVTGITSHIENMAPIVGSVGGMVTVEDAGYFVTAGPLANTPGSNEIWSFNAFTGEHSRVGDFDGVINGKGFSGLAIVPEPTTLGLLLLGSLSLLRRRRC